MDESKNQHKGEKNLTSPSSLKESNNNDTRLKKKTMQVQSWHDEVSASDEKAVRPVKTGTESSLCTLIWQEHTCARTK